MWKPDDSFHFNKVRILCSKKIFITQCGDWSKSTNLQTKNNCIVKHFESLHPLNVWTILNGMKDAIFILFLFYVVCPQPFYTFYAVAVICVLLFDMLCSNTSFICFKLCDMNPKFFGYMLRSCHHVFTSSMNQKNIVVYQFKKVSCGFDYTHKYIKIYLDNLVLG